jgi:hypothetical protein
MGIAMQHTQIDCQHAADEDEKQGPWPKLKDIHDVNSLRNDDCQ